MSQSKLQSVAVVTLLVGLASAGAAPQPKVEVAPTPRAVGAPKTFTVRFIGVEWSDVLDWFAEVSGLTPIYSVAPTGSFTWKPPKDRKFTVGEIIDGLNEAMIQQKLILIRRHASFTIVPADEKIDPILIPRVEIADLKDRGKTELVVVCFVMPHESLVAEETVPEIERMLTPFGAVAGWKSILVIRDTAGNINRIYQTAKGCEDCGGNGDCLKHQFQYRKAQDVGERLLRLLAEPDDWENTRAVRWSVRADEKTNTVTILAPPHKIALARQFIEESDRPQLPLAPAPREVSSPKTFHFEMRDKPWGDVLDWYAEASGLTPIYSVKPTGRFTDAPPKGKQLTLAEITDVLNEEMANQKFILIRRQVSFTIVPTDEKIDYSLVPRIEQSVLPDRGKTELVQVLVPLKTLALEDVAPEVQKMLTPFGKVSNWKNTLIVVDTAGNIRRIIATLKEVESSDDDVSLLAHQLKYKKAQDVAEQLKTLLTDASTGLRAKVVVPGVVVTADEKTNTVTVIGSPEKVALAKKLLEENDRPRASERGDLAPSDLELRKYPVAVGTTDAAVKALAAAGGPSLRSRCRRRTRFWFSPRRPNTSSSRSCRSSRPTPPA